MNQVLAWKISDTVTGHPARPKGCLGQEWDTIWDLVLRCMSKERAYRPSALELVESLEAI